MNNLTKLLYLLTAVFCGIIFFLIPEFWLKAYALIVGSLLILSLKEEGRK